MLFARRMLSHQKAKIRYRTLSIEQLDERAVFAVTQLDAPPAAHAAVVAQAGADTAGNTLATARNFGTISSSRVVTESVGARDRNDFYKFSLDRSQSVLITLTGLSANANLSLLNSNGQRLTISARNGTSSEGITGTLARGTYYVRVFQGSGATSYRLTIAPSALPNIPSVANYNITATGTTYFSNGFGGYDPGFNFTRAGSAYVGRTEDPTNASGNGINVREFGILTGLIGAAGAGNLSFGTNAAVLGSNTAIDVTVVQVNEAKGQIIIDLDFRRSIAELNTLNRFVVGNTLNSDSYQIISGRVIVNFSDQGNSISGAFELYGVGTLSGVPGAIAGTFAGTKN